MSSRMFESGVNSLHIHLLIQIDDELKGRNSTSLDSREDPDRDPSDFDRKRARLIRKQIYYIRFISDYAE